MGIVTRKPVDPWGSAYAVTCAEGAQAVVTSPGPDRELGTDDDIPSDAEDPGAREDDPSS
jgi:hypothetical protein